MSDSQDAGAWFREAEKNGQTLAQAALVGARRCAPGEPRQLYLAAVFEAFTRILVPHQDFPQGISHEAVCTRDGETFCPNTPADLVHHMRQDGTECYGIGVYRGTWG